MGGTGLVQAHPVDRGWSWVICFGGFITHAMLGSAGQTNSVLFVELVKKFETNITTASLIIMCHVIAFSISTVLFPTILLPRLRERRSLIVGGLLLCTASIGCSQATSIGTFIGFSVLKGAASGCVFVPCCCLLRVYFQKRQSTASVIAYCGGSVAAIVAPFVIRAVREEFGISGAYLILGSVELNVCLAGMLMRPTSFYGSQPEEAAEEEEIEMTRQLGQLSTDIKAEYPSADKIFYEKGEFNIFNRQWNRQPSISHRSDKLATIAENELTHGQANGTRDKDGKQQIPLGSVNSINRPPPSPASTPCVLVGSTSSIKSPSMSGRVSLTKRSPAENRKASESTGNGAVVQADDAASGEANGTAHKPVFVTCSNPEEIVKSQEYQVLLEQEKRFLSREISVDDSRSKAPYGSVFTLASEAGRAVEVLLIEEISSLDDGSGTPRWKQFYARASLGLWAFRMTLIAALPGTVNQYLVAYLPTITNAQGASLDQSANLVTIMGAVDLVSRLGMGLLADSKLIPPSKMLSIAQISMGIICQFVWVFSSFPLLILMVMLMGLFVGSRVSLLPLVCTEVVGSERMPQAYSISAMSTALVGAIWGPVLGALAEKTKSFTAVMHFIGTGFIVSGLLMLTLTYFCRLDEKLGHKVKQEKETVIEG